MQQSAHNEAILMLVDALTRAGVRGRADHIGAHPFQDMRYRLFRGRQRPDIIIVSGQKEIVIEIAITEPLRGNALLNRLIKLGNMNCLLYIVTNKEDIESLATALIFNMVRNIVMVGTLETVLMAVLEKLELLDLDLPDLKTPK